MKEEDKHNDSGANFDRLSDEQQQKLIEFITIGPSY